MHSIKSISTFYKGELASIYSSNEAKSITNLVLMHVLNYDKAQLILNEKEELGNDTEKTLTDYLDQLKGGKPVQYVLGSTEFFGLNFKVNASVLIPRLETELLVQWILDDDPKANSSILDIGTGSGIIPISFKHSLPSVSVSAMDISEGALEVAKENARINKVDVEFLLNDILEDKAIDSKYDVIVSNPPYVPIKDKESLHKNVKAFEPHLALFVPNEDALLFYNRISDYAMQALQRPGFLYFEIYEDYANQIAEMLGQKGFQEIEIKKDLADKDRMIRAKLV